MAKDLNPSAPEKSRLRQIFKSKWDVMIESENKLPELRHQLQGHLVNFLKNQTGTWCTYQALDSEINIQPVIQQTSHLQWAWPVMTGSSLRFFVPGPKGFAKGKFGILEPVIDGAAEPVHAAIARLPGLIAGIAASSGGSESAA